MKTWYEAKTGNDQGLIVEEGTGRNVAVAYDKEDAPLIACAPELLEALKTIAHYKAESTGGVLTWEDAIYFMQVAELAIAKAEGKE